jgi:Cu(I)/Ag(I) efflux system membrane fusion protein
MGLAAVAFALFLNCSGNKKEEISHDDHSGHTETAAPEKKAAATEKAAPQFQVDENFQRQLGEVFTKYVSLKEAFVSSDAGKVKSEATAVSQSVDQVDMKLLSGPAHNDWMTYLKPMQNALQEIQSTSDIEAKRKSFSTLSDNLYKSIKAFGIGDKDAYYEYCPMAFDNEGAHWLSDTETIRNPYFGDKMLTCGEVREKL